MHASDLRLSVPLDRPVSNDADHRPWGFKSVSDACLRTCTGLAPWSCSIKARARSILAAILAE